MWPKGFEAHEAFLAANRHEHTKANPILVNLKYFRDSHGTRFDRSRHSVETPANGHHTLLKIWKNLLYFEKNCHGNAANAFETVRAILVLKVYCESTA